jgi:peptide methionine sulfoxide reductase MsrB
VRRRGNVPPPPAAAASGPTAQRPLALPRVRDCVPSMHHACLPPRCVRVRLDVRGCGARAGKYIDNHAKGVYTCGCCNTTLFHSSDKFDARRGYLSFWSQAAVGNVGYKHHEGSWFQHPLDTGLHCEHCGAHLGLPPGLLPAMFCVACLGDSRSVRTLR